MSLRLMEWRYLDAAFAGFGLNADYVADELAAEALVAFANNFHFHCSHEPTASIIGVNTSA